MLSIQPLKSAQAAVDYYFKYYSTDATSQQWLGKGCEYLQLNNKEVSKEQMLALLEGKLPDGRMLQNFKGEHRPGFDMTFSAPKSVSILVGLSVAPQLQGFHDAAVKYAIGKIEAEFAEVRIRRNGQIQYEKPDNLVIAAFRQHSSRANDPALHTHAVTMNMSFLDGKARSLASDPSRQRGVVEQVQNNAHYCGLLYRQHLANQLKNAGFKIQLVGDGLFEIAGVPDALLQEFSKRRADIEQLLANEGWSGAKSAAIATLLTRSGKEEHDLQTLQENWQQRAKEHGFDGKDFMQNFAQHSANTKSKFSIIADKLLSLIGINNNNNNNKTAAALELDAALACLNVATETLSQKTAVFTERALFAECLKHSLLCPNAIAQENITKVITQATVNQSLYVARDPNNGQKIFTTPWLLTLEAESITRIENNKGIVPAISSKQAVQEFQRTRANKLPHVMTKSQQQAMLTLLTTTDRYLAIQGYAGVAKTSMLAETKIFLHAKGYQLRGATVASSAANELQTKAGISADVFPVVHQELKNATTGSLTKMIYIVDEASQLSSPQGHALIKEIERTQARLILVGDKAQLPSINAGRIFSLTQDYGIKTATMHEIVRQKNHKLKQAVVHATAGEVDQALQKLHVQELATYTERVTWIANQWLSLTPQLRAQTLLFAPTHANREAITNIIREGLKNEHSLTGTSINHTVLKAKNLAPMQQRFIGYYQSGEVLRFNQTINKQNIKLGEYYTVGSITAYHQQKNILPLINQQGKKQQFSLKYLPAYKTHNSAFERVIEVYQPKNIELQVGDKLMWTRNSKGLNIRNGQCFSLQEITAKELVFLNQDGVLIKLDKTNAALKHLDYSYVLTNYKVQGKDAAFGLGLMESYQQNSTNLNNFYVQISRAIHNMTLVTDDKEKLIAAIKHNTIEKLASLDILSSKQLVSHELKLKEPGQLSIQPVIDKTIQIESNKIYKLSNQNQIPEMSYAKSNHCNNVHIKEGASQKLIPEFIPKSAPELEL